MRNSMRFGTMAGTVGMGLWLTLFVAGTAVGQGDIPGHARIRTVAMAPGIEGLPALPAEGQPDGQNPQAKDDLFAGTDIFAKNATGVQEITMDPDSLNMVGGAEGHRAHNMVLNVVRTYSYDKPGMYNMADVDTFRNKLTGGDWHCSVHIRDLKNGSSTDVCSKHRTDGMRENAIITVEPKSLTFIHTIRKTGGPESEMGVFPMMYRLPGLPAIAMMNPQAMINLQMALHGLPGEMAPLGNPDVFKVIPRIDSEKIVRNMQEFQKQMNSPEMQQKMKDFQLKFKDFENSPEMKQKRDELMKQFDKKMPNEQ